MSIRFSAPVTPAARHRLVRARRRAHLRAANDNQPDCANDGDQLLHAALRHFAAHGLAAAQEARKIALAAEAEGDSAAFNWWRDICQTLDRRLAAGLERQAETGS